MPSIFSILSLFSALYYCDGASWSKKEQKKHILPERMDRYQSLKDKRNKSIHIPLSFYLFYFLLSLLILVLWWYKMKRASSWFPFAIDYFLLDFVSDRHVRQLKKKMSSLPLSEETSSFKQLNISEQNNGNIICILILPTKRHARQEIIHFHSAHSVGLKKK